MALASGAVGSVVAGVEDVCGELGYRSPAPQSDDSGLSQLEADLAEELSRRPFARHHVSGSHHRRIGRSGCSGSSALGSAGTPCDGYADDRPSPSRSAGTRLVLHCGDATCTSGDTITAPDRGDDLPSSWTLTVSRSSATWVGTGTPTSGCSTARTPPAVSFRGPSAVTSRRRPPAAHRRHR